MCEPRREEEDAFPAVTHRKLAVGAVAVKKKGLAEDRQKPVADEKECDREHLPVASLRLFSRAVGATRVSPARRPDVICPIGRFLQGFVIVV